MSKCRQSLHFQRQRENSSEKNVTSSWHYWLIQQLHVCIEMTTTQKQKVLNRHIVLFLFVCLPANVPLLRHSLMRLALRTWKALVISWFMKLSLFRTLATIIRRSKTSSSSAMVATCIRSPRPSSRWPVYRY